ncbi:MAG: glycosyltransferase [Bacteroidetes bacterium]|nr:glycosyltransferase [Bacteroidota bacterium]
MPSSVKKRVLIAPLDWGLGHATRCVPVIKEFLRQKADVILAAGGKPAKFLKKEFPDLRVLKFPGYNITYPRHRFLALHLAMLSPFIAARVRNERKTIRKIVAENEIDIIVSDNRFGCRTPETYNVYITHQLNVLTPFGKKAATKFHKKYYELFDEVWVPDVDGKINMSGELGHEEGNHPFTHYVGPLTRFLPQDILESRKQKWWLTIVLSGPEPQRSILEKTVMDECAKFSEEILLVRGLPEGGKKTERKFPHVTIADHMNDDELKENLMASMHVLCRPGYSALCDLSALNITPIVIPTPGQTEQEYLAGYHSQMRHLVSFPQKKFNLGKAIREKAQMNLFGIYADKLALERRVRKVLHK